MTVKCKECKNDIELSEDQVEVGRWFECPTCGTTHEVVSVNNGVPETETVEEEK